MNLKPYKENSSSDEEDQNKHNLSQYSQKESKNIFIKDPIELYNFCKNHKKILLLSEQYPPNQKIEIIDFSLHERGPPEDRRFAKDAQLRFNIRRGNAFCKIEEDVFIIRRGMRKFYDIEPAFLKN